MADLTEVASGITDKVNRLIAEVILLKAKVERLQQEITSINAENEQLKLSAKDSEERYRILKTAKTLETKEGTVEAKVKINELLREIDKCIGLLNT